MFQRELLYAAGGRACTWLAAALGGAGRPAGPQGCVRAGGQDNVCGRLQPPDRSARRAGDRHIPPANAQKRKGEPGRTGKKDLPDLPKILLPVWAIGRRFPRAWVDIDIHHGLW